MDEKLHKGIGSKVFGGCKVVYISVNKIDKAVMIKPNDFIKATFVPIKETSETRSSAIHEVLLFISSWAYVFLSGQRSFFLTLFPKFFGGFLSDVLGIYQPEKAAAEKFLFNLSIL